MGSFFIWHWLIMLIVIGGPLLIVALVLTFGRQRRPYDTNESRSADLASLTTQVRQMLTVGQKIEAIDAVRQATGMSLVQAKAWVESLE